MRNHHRDENRVDWAYAGDDNLLAIAHATGVLRSPTRYTTPAGDPEPDPWDRLDEWAALKGAAAAVLVVAGLLLICWIIAQPPHTCTGGWQP